MRNSVFEELRVRRFADVQEEICCKGICNWAIQAYLSQSYEDRKRKKLSIICVKVVVYRKRGDESAEGVVYMTKSRGPRTEH